MSCTLKPSFDICYIEWYKFTGIYVHHSIWKQYHFDISCELLVSVKRLLVVLSSISGLICQLKSRVKTRWPTSKYRYQSPLFSPQFNNACRTEFIWRNIKRVCTYHQFAYVEVQTGQIHPCGKQGLVYLKHPGVWDKPRMFEIDWSQPRHETAFCWRDKGPVT